MEEHGGSGGRGRDRARGGSRGGGGGRTGGRDGGRGGGRGGRPENRSVDVSRALSRLLRHQAAAAGVALDDEGYAALDHVLAWGPLRSMGVTLAEVQEIVATNDKQRFALREKPEAAGTFGPDDPSAWLIRANQGHSIAVGDGLLEPLDAETAPVVVCHATFLAAWPAIVAAGGLRPMGRNHVHCGGWQPEAGDGPTGPEAEAQVLVRLAQDPRPIPGLRKNAELLIFLDVRRALREAPALRWWRAANGVVLSEGDGTGVVPLRFFRRVVTTAAGTALLPPIASAGAAEPAAPQALTLWEDGEKRADVPAIALARARMPSNMRSVAKQAAVKNGGGPGRPDSGPKSGAVPADTAQGRSS